LPLIFYISISDEAFIDEKYFFPIVKLGRKEAVRAFATGKV
jgi:hypothetical protein